MTVISTAMWFVQALLFVLFFCLTLSYCDSYLSFIIYNEKPVDDNSLLTFPCYCKPVILTF